MNWKTEAKEKLRCYPARKNAACVLAEEIAMLKSDFESIHAVDMNAVPVSGGGSRHEERMISNIQERGELQSALVHTQRCIRNVERSLKLLDKNDRYVLEHMYIHPDIRRSELARELGFADDRSLYRQADRALRRFTLAYYGELES